MADTPTPTAQEALQAQLKKASAHNYLVGFGIVLDAHKQDMTKAASVAKPRLEAAMAATEKRASVLSGIMDIVLELRKPAQTQTA